MHIWNQLHYSIIPADRSIQQELDLGHTAADVYRPSYRLMPIALELLISLEVCFKFVELWNTYELVLLSLDLSPLIVMS